MPRKTKEEVLEEFRCSGIEDAAIAVIARRGIDHATVQEIADEAGIAKGTIYVYFHDREELLSRTANRAFDRLLTELEPAFDSAAPFAEQLMAVVLLQLQFFEENAALFRATMALSRRENEVHKNESTGSHRRYLERLEAMFTTAKKRGELRDYDPRAIAAVYRDCLRGVLIRRLEGKSRASRDDEAAFVVSILLRGIQADRKSSKETA
jgi:AcrR family transcriptional regulator